MCTCSTLFVDRCSKIFLLHRHSFLICQFGQHNTQLCNGSVFFIITVNWLIQILLSCPRCRLHTQTHTGLQSVIYLFLYATLGTLHLISYLVLAPIWLAIKSVLRGDLDSEAAEFQSHSIPEKFGSKLILWILLDDRKPYANCDS